MCSAFLSWFSSRQGLGRTCPYRVVNFVCFPSLCTHHTDRGRPLLFIFGVNAVVPISKDIVEIPIFRQRNLWRVFVFEPPLFMAQNLEILNAFFLEYTFVGENMTSGLDSSWCLPEPLNTMYLDKSHKTHTKVSTRSSNKIY